MFFLRADRLQAIRALIKQKQAIRLQTKENADIPLNQIQCILKIGFGWLRVTTTSK